MSLQHQYNGRTKFIIVTGGVISGLGKGVAAASIGALLSARMKVVPVKCDGYLNTDPGTMNPTEHGEVLFWTTAANATWTSATTNAF